MPDVEHGNSVPLTPEEVEFKGFVDPLLAEMVVRTGLDMTYVNIWHASGIQESRYVCNIGGLGLKAGDTMSQKDSICIRCREAGILWTSDLQGDLPGTILDGSDLNTYLSIPLYASDGSLMGTLCALGRERRKISQPVLSYAQSLGRAIAAYLDRPVSLPEAVRLDTDARADAGTIPGSNDVVGTLLGALPDAVLLLQSTGVGCTILSASGQPLHGAPATLAAQDVRTVFPESVATVVRETAHEALQRGRTAQVTYYVPGSGPGAWFSARVTPMADGRVLWVARDTTEQHTMEAALREAIAMGSADARAKGDFLTAMSHELRTPLNAIIGFAAVLGANRGERLNGLDMKYVERIHTNGVKLLGMVEQVLEFASADAGVTECTMAPTDLGQLVEALMGEFKVQGTRDEVAVVANIPSGQLPLALTDAVQLRSVLAHLVGNAIKYTSVGRVAAALVVDPGTSCPIRVDISDTGPGIPADRLAAIMAPFEQGTNGMTRVDAGLGLGLSTARILCQQLGLGLTASSTVGVGSTFSIHFGPETVVR